MGDVVLSGVGDELLAAAHAVTRSLRVGPVVEPRVQNTGVAPRLVSGDARFLLNDDDAEAWLQPDQRERTGEADYAATDDGDVVVLRSRNSFCHLVCLPWRVWRGAAISVDSRVENG